MAGTYTTNVERIAARLKARGVPSDKALNMAEKQASAMRKRANPGQKGRLGKRHTFKRNTDPVPPKEKKPMKKEDIKKYASTMIMEIHGITGLIASPPASSMAGTSDVGSIPPVSGTAPLSAKYANKDNDDVTKTGRKGGKTAGFKSSGGPKAKVTRAKPGSVTKGPETLESIETEFGIK